MEVITLLQTGKRDMVPVVLIHPEGSRYWNHLHEFVVDQLLANSMISVEDLSLYKIVDNVYDAMQEVLRFFAVYHSMRYVKHRLVFRLQRELTASQLLQINERFADLLGEGEFTQSAPLPEEADEPELASLNRLVFCFNRRAFGRLRQLIDELNSFG
jgi:hypothetical protein